MALKVRIGDDYDHDTTSGVREVFRHVDLDGLVRHFSIPTLTRMIRTKPEDWSLSSLPLTKVDVDHVLKNNGVEKERIKAYPLSKLDIPGIACIFPEGSILIVDGSHRLVKRFRRGLKTMEFYMAPENVWKAALIDPAQLLKIR